MSEFLIRTFRDEEADSVVDLWGRCGLHAPHNDPHAMIRRKTAFQPDLFLVGEDDGRVVATVMAGYEGRRGWINLLAVDPPSQGSGWGRAIMVEAERRLVALGCPKINLQVRETNTEALEFYARLGYVVDRVHSLGKLLD